jgi:hypothetical protein
LDRQAITGIEMNYILYSDLHIQESTQEICDLVLTRVGELAKKYKAKIINGGDTHNTRGILKTSSLDLLTRHYNQWAEDGLAQNILVGNHDQEDREGDIHPMRSYELHPNWHVIDRPTVLDGVAYFPYMPRERVKDAIDEIPKGVKTAVVHWGIQGAKRNDFNVDTDGIPVEWLAKFRRVFSGHYHYRNAFANVQYIGDPYQQNHSESNQPKGVILYDNDKDKISFIEIEGTPRFYEVSYKIAEKGKIVCESEDCDLGKIKKTDHVKVKVEGDSEAVSSVTHEDVARYFNCDNVKFDRAGTVKSHSRLGIAPGEALDPLTLMNKYVAFVDTKLDRKKLMQIGGELIR